MIVSLLTVVGKPALAGLSEAVAASLADRLAAAGVIVVWVDVAEPLVQPDGVVLELHAGKLSAQRGWVPDREQVRPLALDAR